MDSSKLTNRKNPSNMSKLEKIGVEENETKKKRKRTYSSRDDDLPDCNQQMNNKRERYHHQFEAINFVRECPLQDDKQRKELHENGILKAENEKPRAKNKTCREALSNASCGESKTEKEDTVKLISAEGFEFVIDRQAAMVSRVIRGILTSPGEFRETRERRVRFPEISTVILGKICEYFYWYLEYANGKEETEFHIKPELSLKLMEAANYLLT